MDVRDGKKFIPSLLTIGNLALGFIACILTYDGLIATAALMVLISMVLDAFDGRIARWIGCESAFGKELDALSDIVAFGVAPAFIMYVAALRFDGVLGDVAAIVFPVSGALRLARFNVQKSSLRYFVGLPITAAGGIVATFALYRSELGVENVLMPIGLLVLSGLMLSKARYPNFKRIGFPKSAMIGVPLLTVLTYVAFRFDRTVANRLVFVPLALYAIYGVLRFIRKRPLGTVHDPKQDTKPL